MFSDCGYAKLCRSIATSFSPGRNTTALIEPAVGVAFVFGSAGGLLMTVGGMGVRPLPVTLLMVAVVAFVVLLLGLIPFSFTGTDVSGVAVGEASTAGRAVGCGW